MVLAKRSKRTRITYLSILPLSSPGLFSDFPFVISLSPDRPDLSFLFPLVNLSFALWVEYRSRLDSYLGHRPVASQASLRIDQCRSISRYSFNHFIQLIQLFLGSDLI